MDQNRYVNAYVDIAVGTIHEILGSNLQAKAQLKIANDLIVEKDQIIGDLQSKLNGIKNNDEDVRRANENATHWENSYHAMAAKIAHMDTLIAQLKEMKTLIADRDAYIKEKDDNINTLKQKIEELQNPKKVINIKKTKPVVEPAKEKEQDDF